MSKSIKQQWILAAAVGMVTAGLSSVSMAQYRVNTGNVLDANPRIGSGGVNQGADTRLKNGVTGNDIVTGNVTGGKEFRGHVPYGEDRSFRGNISRPSDNFVRDSSGTPYGGFGGYNSNSNTPRKFYGDSAAITPQGFIQNNIGTGGYVPGPVQMRQGSDLRLGNPLDTQPIALPAPGQTLMAGPVDPSTNLNTLITASSLYGVRQWNSGNPSDQMFVSRYANALGENVGATPLSDLEVGAMRREMQQAASPNLATDVLGGGAISSNPNQSALTPSANPNLAAPVAAPSNAPKNDALGAGQLTDTVASSPLQGGLTTGESVQSRVLVPAAQQSQTNAALQARLDQAAGKKPGPISDADAARNFNRDMQGVKDAQAKAQGQNQPGANQPGAAQPGGAAPMPGGATPTPGVDAPAPVPGPTNIQGKTTAPPQVKSFSEGFKAKGPAELLKKGDGLMKEGKWFDAIEQFDLAQQVAPNNMLITVGRATAELGGSTYGRAEADLRTAFTNDPAMLEGQYDLRTMIGDDRLQFLVKDLKEIASKNPTQSRPVFLLAYIAYNTGNERMAAGYLDLAEKRAGANDPFYGLVRKHWTLPDKADAPAIDLNKQ